MNYLKHRLLAGFLACVLLLSASPMALSAEVDAFSSGASSGVTSNEGNKPENLINLVMPTDREGLFDFLIDPAGMVRSTNAARYLSKWGVESVEIGDGNLFFRNIGQDSDGSTTIALSNKSDPLTIINKSSTAVDVSLSFEVSQTSGGYDFAFVDNDKFQDENGAALTSPAMYLAIKAGRRSGPVHAETAEGVTKYVGSIKGWLPQPDGDFLDVLWDGEKYFYRLKDNIPETAFHSMSFYMTGAINADTVDWNGANDANLTVTWNVTKLASNATEDPYMEDFPPLVEVRVGAKERGDEVVLLIDYGEGRTAMTKVDGIAYTASDESEALYTNVTVNGSILTLTANNALLRGHDWAVRFSNDAGQTVDVPFNIKKDVDPVDPTATVITKATAADESAVLKVDWGAGSAAMSTITGVKYTKEDSTPGTIPSTRITVEDDTVTITLTATPFAGSDFILMFANSAGGTFELPVDLTQTPDTDPSVTNVQKATAAGQSAVLTVDWGSGDKAMTTVTKVKYTRASGTAGSISSSNITIDGNTVSVTLGTTPFAGHDFILLFSNASGATFELPVELVGEAEPDEPSQPDEPIEPVESVDPSVTNVQKATAAGQSAVLTVNWGSGDKAMTTVSKVKYTRASGTEGSISSSNITVSGTTVTIKVGTTPFGGHDFILLFSNASGATFELPVELTEVADVDPSVTAVTKASSAGSSAVVTVDWGGGSKAMTTVNSVKYKKADGAAATISSSNITVSGNTVTIKIASEPFVGSDFSLVFANASGGTFEVSADLVDNTSSGGGSGSSNDSSPYVIVSTPATAINAYATLTVNLGSDSQAMTSVTGLVYNKNGYTNDTTLKAGTTYVQVSGNTVTIKATSNVYNGSNWRLLLADDNEHTATVAFDLKTAGIYRGSGNNSSGSGGNQSGGGTDTGNTSVTGNGSPVLSVTQTATAVNAYVTVEITDWGNMTSVTGLVYNKNGSTDDTTLKAGTTYVQVSGNTVTIKATSNVYNGSNWRLAFSNGNTTYVSPALELK